MNRPWDAEFAAVIRAVAEGSDEFGHMYRRMKSSALKIKRPRVSNITTRAEVSLLISCISSLWKCRGCHDGVCVIWLQCPVHEFEVRIIMLRTDMLLIFREVN